MFMFLESPSKGTFSGEITLLYISLPTLVSIWIIVPVFSCPGASANGEAVPGVVVVADDILDLALVRYGERELVIFLVWCTQFDEW